MSYMSMTLYNKYILEMVEDTQIQKGLKERIQNHILHVQFKRKISVSQSNLLYP